MAVRKLRDMGAEVAIILPPETERRRRSVPPEALLTFESCLRDAFGATAPPILNLRDSMPDEDFSDLSHLDPKGSAAFSKKLAVALEGLPVFRASLRPRAEPDKSP